MTTAATGDTVRIHYSGRLVDGTPFDSSEGRAPLEFTLGQGQVIKGLEAHVTGMETGDQLQARTADGGMLPITVVGVDEQSVTVDANHPLAGQDLVFDVELVEVVKAA